MEIDLKGKTVLITGGASGAGTAIVKEFAKTGANIAFTFCHTLPDDLLKELGDTGITAYHFDQSDLGQIDELLAMVLRDYGHIDVLINNAGIYPAKAFDQISEADYDAMMDTNVKGIFFLSRAVSKVMDKGSIINISSINATNPARKLIHYGMSKAAIEMETRCLAYELGPNIRVNCIAPGLIYKEGQEQWIPGWTESYKERSALHRLVDPSEIGKAAVFFASDLSSAVTGQILTVDCGVSLAPY
ncbi:MAG: SDR family oxidoreductase, partial [Erysipelotrichaceae bacterium]|nr:SDR family oxidoreductase [Erysipelotrichaceae bacterium]